MLELLVGGCGGYKKAVSVPCGEAPNDAGTTDGGMDDRDDILELSFECRVEVCRALDCTEGVGVRELGEDADVAAVFELGTCMPSDVTAS